MLYCAISLLTQPNRGWLAGRSPSLTIGDSGSAEDHLTQSRKGETRGDENAAFQGGEYQPE